MYTFFSIKLYDLNNVYKLSQVNNNYVTYLKPSIC